MKKYLISAVLMIGIISTLAAQQITSAEYFFDADPGPGNGIPVSIATPADTVALPLNVSVTGLTAGPHYFCLRMKNAQGDWSLQQSRLFYINPAPPSPNQQIAQAEYFFDADPGVGNGTSISIATPADTVNLQATVNTAGLSAGSHLFCLRVKDMQGEWSLQQSRLFYVNPQAPSPNQQVSQAEYFLDTDPGPGNGTAVAIPNGDTVLSSFNIANPFTSGSHYFVFRTRDDDGNWSLQMAKKFNVCSSYGANSDFSFFGDRKKVFFNNTSQYDTAFSWDFGDATTNSIQRNPVHTYAAPGIYNVRLISTNSCATDTFTQAVAVDGLQSIFPNFSADTNFFVGIVKGVGFQPGCVVRLQRTGYPDIVADTTIYGSATSVVVRFNFNHDPAGTYHVIAENPAGVVLDTLFNAFKIEPNIINQVNVAFSGVNRIRTGRQGKGRFTITNQGNTTLYFLPFFIYLTGDSSIQFTSITSFDLDVTVLPQISALIPPGHAYPLDDPANPFADGIRMIAGVIPILGPGASQDINFSTQSPTTTCTKVKIRVGEPLDNWVLNPFTNSCDFLPKVGKCAMDLLGLVPVAGCVVGFAGWACSVNGAIENMANTGQVGDKKWDLIASTASTALSCVPGVSTAVGAIKIGSDIAQGISNSSALIGDCLPTPPDRRPEKEIELCYSNSFDPNEKTGPQGITSDNYINKYEDVMYMVKFENMDTATAPAAVVEITDILDTSKFDLSTFALKGFGFGDSIYAVNAEFRVAFVQDIDLRGTRGIWLRVKAGLDTITGKLDWSFSSYDSTTFDDVANPLLGFLPPNVNAPEGEGFVTFSVRPKTSLNHLDLISNSASIVFDNNDSITTNAWLNTIDTIKPTSIIQPLAASQNDTLFKIITNGTDAHAGILDYIIYASINDSAFKPVFDGAPDTLWFVGDAGNQYEFFSQARDRARNTEDTIHSPDAVTVITVGIDKLPQTISLEIYPNPSTASVTLQINDTKKRTWQVSLYSIEGKKEASHNLQSNEKMILPLTSYPSGTYYLKIENEAKQYLIKKIIILK